MLNKLDFYCDELSWEEKTTFRRILSIIKILDGMPPSYFNYAQSTHSLSMGWHYTEERFFGFRIVTPRKYNLNGTFTNKAGQLKTWNKTFKTDNLVADLCKHISKIQARLKRRLMEEVR
jgi:hypothetical protein